MSPVDGILKSLELEDLGACVVYRGDPIGKLQVCAGSSGISLKAICKKHPSCLLYITAKIDYFVRYGIVMSWLKDAATDDEATHKASAQRIKDGFGIKSKKPSPASSSSP